MIDESQSIALKHVQFCVGQICEEPVCKFLACLEQHALVRELSSSTFYWVCAYANNQHCVEEDIKSNPRSTSFYRELSRCLREFFWCWIQLERLSKGFISLSAWAREVQDAIAWSSFALARQKQALLDLRSHVEPSASG